MALLTTSLQAYLTRIAIAEREVRQCRRTRRSTVGELTFPHRLPYGASNADGAHRDAVDELEDASCEADEAASAERRAAKRLASRRVLVRAWKRGRRTIGWTRAW